MTVLVPLLVAAGIVPAIPQSGDCHPIDSESVLARDVAPLAPGFARLPEDFLIGYVEPTGAPKVFRGADLERIAKNRGVELQGLEDLCLERRTFVVPGPSIAEAMRKNIKNPAAKIEILFSTQQAVPTGEIVFPKSGIQLPAAPEVTWRGYVQSGTGARYPISARARITVPVHRVIAGADLVPGKPIEKEQIRVEESEDSPFEEGFIEAENEAIGLVAKGTIFKGSSIRGSQVAAPPDVARGDTVRVDVFAGNAHLTLEARAEASGMKGSTITVRNVATGKDFQAKVTGKGQVRVGGVTE